jgi:hypothetical protein
MTPKSDGTMLMNRLREIFQKIGWNWLSQTTDKKGIEDFKEALKSGKVKRPTIKGDGSINIKLGSEGKWTKIYPHD